MMVLQLISENKKMLQEIGDLLILEELITNVIISDAVLFKSKAEDGSIATIKKYTLKGISKSLLFNTINNLLRDRYKEKMPLLYSEPIILIDAEHRDLIMNSLSKV